MAYNLFLKERSIDWILLAANDSLSHGNVGLFVFTGGIYHVSLSLHLAVIRFNISLLVQSLLKHISKYSH